MLIRIYKDQSRERIIIEWVKQKCDKRNGSKGVKKYYWFIENFKNYIYEWNKLNR